VTSQANSLPDWVQYIQALAPTVVAFIIGGVAAYIAWRQWETANHRLRLDLYEKRFGVYSAAKTLLNRAALHGAVRMEDVGEFYDGVRGAEFLFDGETKDFVMTLGTMAIKARLKRSQLERHPDHPRADKLIAEEEDILDYLRTKDETLEELFRPYLDLSKITAR
jgi:hypothetical protein